ncbi:uncharacterized protein LOC105202004 [Solenopsis invicta]|uniref:uncharacterized protein LOC105202004 n=1 Tax=Solenopsis invicta TaxID=13686 RepID=UPI00193D036C|nr:uncharacterized protein LOC105202004 [Solenopsis invicta]
MDDVNINKICLDIEEVELDGDEAEWIKLSWTGNQSDNDGNSQSAETQRDSDNETAHTKDCDGKEFTNAESEDVSDGISVITESDTDAVNTNLLQICQFEPHHQKPHKPLHIPEMQMAIWDIFLILFGIGIGLILSYIFMFSNIYSVSNGVDAESLKAASHNIVNTCKELTDVKTMLNEIKAHIPADKNITRQFLAQFLEITDFSNKTSSKPIIITKEFFNSTSHPLDQLQMSLHVLSSLAFIYDDNSPLKNEINKTLDILNNTKMFYDTLALFTKNTQDIFEPIVLNFLQHNSDNMHIASKSLLSNLAEKVSKITLKVYNKYTKERHKLNKKLCHLKSILPDDKLLKRLTENNQLFKDYDKSCFSNYTSKNLDGGSTTKGNTKTKSVKEQKNEGTDDEVHTKYDKKNTDQIRDNKENLSKDKINKRRNIDKYTTMKVLRNTGHKIHNASELLFSVVTESVNKLRRELSKTLPHLKNILPNNSEFLKQLIEGDEEDNKEPIKRHEGKNDYLQSNIIPKNNYDNILIPPKNTCPLSTNYCPKFNINVSTFDTVPNHKTKNYKHKKHVDNKKTTINHENSAKILPTEGKSGPKKKDYFKSNDSKKAISNKINYERKNISSENKMKDHVSEHTVNYHKSEHSLFDSRPMKQDNQRYINTDGRSDSKSSYEYKKRRQRDDSDWYFRRVHSRRNARRHAEHMYQQNAKWFWKNHR